MLQNNNGRPWSKSQENFKKKINQLHVKRKTELHLIKMLLLGNSILFYQNLADKIPRVTKTFHQEFSLVEIQLDQYDLTLQYALFK